MKISKIYSLNKTQYQLDFVDVDIEKDIELFIDSNLIRKYDSEFNLRMSGTIDSFFTYLINLLKNNEDGKAMILCSHLGEINETHLGMSKGKSRGKGVGPGNSNKIFNSLKSSKALADGVLSNVEDLRVMVPGFDKDLLSDILTNILKKYLIEYTIQQCELHNIPLVDNVPSGFFWDDKACKWDQFFTKRLIIDNNLVLLVPKKIVNFKLNGSFQEYKQHFVLNYLQDENINNMTNLVHRRKKTRELFVIKKDIVKSEPIMDKDYLSSFTIKHPNVYEKFKKGIIENSHSLDGNLLEQISIDYLCDILVSSLVDVPTGSEHASEFHNLMIGIFELLLYPNCINPKKETEINEGRKRIDISYTNVSTSGFLKYIKDKLDLPCPLIYVECKNYSSDISNPELDQLAGRFSNNRGRFGILSCRKIDQEDLFIKRCSDAYKDGNGLIIPISDKDILRCLEKKGFCSTELDKILFEKAEKIIRG